MKTTDPTGLIRKVLLIASFLATALLLLLVGILLAVCKHEQIGKQVVAGWDIVTRHWFITSLVVIVPLIVWRALKKDDHHHGHSGGIGSLKGWLVPIGMAFVCYHLGGCLENSSEQAKRRTDLAIEKYAREATNGAPPTTEWVQMGSWTNVLAPGQFTDVEFFLNSTTSFKQSGAVLLQRGRGRGDRFVSDGSPIVLVRPEDRARFSAGQTARLYGPHDGTNNVVVVVTRQP